jgi:hypothetical protein
MKKTVFIFVLLFAFVACQDKSKNMPYGEDVTEMHIPSAASLSKRGANEVGSRQETDDEQFEQRIIKTGFLSFETTSLNNTYNSIAGWVKANKGYVQSDISDKGYDRISRSIVIRIPNIAFQKVIDSIYSQTEEFDRKEIKLQDVTEEFVDIEARLIAKRKLEARYLQLLDKAKTVEDMLKIEQQIANIREAIEAKQGRLKYLNNQVSFSTLHVNFYQTTKLKRSQSYLIRLWQAIKGGIHGAGEFVIRLVYGWPFLLIGIFVVYIIKKRLQKRHNNLNK